MSDNPGSEESAVTVFGSKVSMRGLLVLVLIVTLCALTLIHPDTFASSFESISIAVVAFYFGQATKKPTQ